MSSHVIPSRGIVVDGLDFVKSTVACRERLRRRQHLGATFPNHDRVLVVGGQTPSRGANRPAVPVLEHLGRRLADDRLERDHETVLESPSREWAEKIRNGRRFMKAAPDAM